MTGLTETLKSNGKNAGQRLDQFVANGIEGISRNRASNLISSGYVLLDGNQAKPSTRIKSGQSVAVTIPPPFTRGLKPQQISIGVIYEDEDVLIVDKPSGIPVHPGPGHPDGTLMNGVFARCPDVKDIDDTLRPGMVHRLDKDTSGLMVFAKSSFAQTNISRQMSNRSVNKLYTVLVKGRLDKQEAFIDAPIGRDPFNRQKMAVVEHGKEARSKYKLLTRFLDFDLIQVKLLTGRTHQIRVHLSAIGHPVAGDQRYGGQVGGLSRQFLHASVLGFSHPSRLNYVEYSSPLPEDLKSFMESLYQS